jgi:predicted ATPase
MPALLKIYAENYKSLEQVEVELGNLNVLVGPNGSGKTNLLDLIDFLGDSVRADIGPALDLRGGYDRVVFRGAPRLRTGAVPVRIRVEANVTDFSSDAARDVYRLTFWVRRVAERQALVRREWFKFKRTQGRGRRIEINGSNVGFIDEQASGADTLRRKEPILRSDSLALATLPRLADREGGKQVRQIAELFSTFRVFDIDVPAARLPSPVTEALSLRHDASNLAAFLLRLAREEEEIFEQLVEDARAFVPGLLNIHFQPVGGSEEAVAVELEDEALPGRTRLAEASFGTIRALGLLAMLYDPEPPLLTCVEEIDHGLHPYVFDRLVDRLRAASKRTQLIIATHSPALVNRLSANELIVCERGERGESLIPAVDSELVREMEASVDGELGLGELWFSGTLGGVPS